MNQASQSAAEMMSDETDIPVETPLPILPEPIDAGIILGIVLTIIGGVIWLLTCYIVLTRSPRKKEKSISAHTSGLNILYQYFRSHFRCKMNFERLLYGKLPNVLCLLFKFHLFGWNLNYLFYTLLVMVLCTNPFLTLQETDNLQ